MGYPRQHDAFTLMDCRCYAPDGRQVSPKQLHHRLPVARITTAGCLTHQTRKVHPKVKDQLLRQAAQQYRAYRLKPVEVHHDLD